MTDETDETDEQTWVFLFFSCFISISTNPVAGGGGWTLLETTWNDNKRDGDG